MLEIQDIITELENRGYESVSEQRVTKNNVPLKGISVRRHASDRIAPVVYVDRMLQQLQTPAQVAELIEEAVSSRPYLDIGDPDQLISKSRLKRGVLIGLQRTSAQADLIRRDSPLDGIEEYLYLAGEAAEGEHWRIRLNPAILAHADMDEEAVWHAAEKNTYRAALFQAEELTHFLIRALGDSIPLPPEETVPMYVISNPQKYHGASQILNREALHDWAASKGFGRLVVLPSSVHEVIVLPGDDAEFPSDDLNAMIREVNAMEVDPVEQLSDRAYLIEV